jgi:hypothetical protein
MKMLVVASVEHCVKSVIWRTTMSEPRLEDDIAIGKNQDCDECDESEDDCTCAESAYDTLEEMYDDF